MFKNENEFKKIVDNLNIDDHPNDNHRQELRQQMLKTFNKKQDSQNKNWPNIRKITKQHLPIKLAAAVIFLLPACWFIADNRNEPQQQATNGQQPVAARSQTPAELMSLISLNMAFRDGDMEAIEKQFDKAEKRVTPTLKERITIDQLMCELDYCKEI